MQTGSVTQGATISCFCLKSMRANAGLARRRMQVAFYRPGGLAFFAVSTADGERKPLSIHSDRRLIRQNPGHAERQLNRGSNHECYRSRSDRLVACGGAADFCRSDMAQMAVAMARHQPGGRSAGAALCIRGAIQPPALRAAVAPRLPFQLPCLKGRLCQILSAIGACPGLARPFGAVFKVVEHEQTDRR